MFYQDTIEPQLRFGDVLKGFVVPTPTIQEPFLSIPHCDLEIKITFPIFSIVLSPCCSINENTISLTPLIKVKNNFFDNPCFVADLTRINTKMEPQMTVKSEIWELFSAEEKQKRLNIGLDYALTDYFIYDKHDIFDKYKLKGTDIETKYYMIDFSNTYKINCKNLKPLRESALRAKCLQLSVEARDQLRAKITNYYGRIPAEDKALLTA